MEERMRIRCDHNLFKERVLPKSHRHTVLEQWRIVTYPTSEQRIESKEENHLTPQQSATDRFRPISGLISVARLMRTQCQP